MKEFQMNLIKNISHAIKAIVYLSFAVSAMVFGKIPYELYFALFILDGIMVLSNRYKKS